MLHRLIFAAAALGAATAGFAQEPEQAPPRQPLDAAAQEQTLAFASERGRLLHAIDRAAWVATDDMQAKMRNWRRSGMRGYVVDRDGSGLQVLFFGGPEDAPIAFYRAQVAEHRVVSSEVYSADARPSLTPLQRRLAAARSAAASAVRGRPCGSSPFNTAVVPPDTADGPIDVYFLTPQAARRQYPLGGHYRLTVDAGGQVIGERAFTRSCLTFDERSVRGARGGTITAMVMTHLLDPVPTEIHVFTSLASGFPLYVSAGGRMWRVTGAEIAEIRL